MLGLKSGSRLGPYRIVRRMGSGPVADLYEARTLEQPGFPSQPVALKVLRSRRVEVADDDEDDEDDEDLLLLFQAEGEIAARLNHPNLVRFLERGEAEGHHYLASELISGPSLAKVLDARRRSGALVPCETALYIGHELLRGLEHMHGADVLHLAVSPRHVMLSEAGEVKLLGFGGARAAGLAGRTRAGMLHGDHFYLAPEQFQGKPVDQRTDLFSVALLLYEALTGLPARGGRGRTALIDQVLGARLPPLREARPLLDPAMGQTIMSALAATREERPAGAGAMADIIAEWLQRHGPLAGAAAVKALVTADPGPARSPVPVPVAPGSPVTVPPPAAGAPSPRPAAIRIASPRAAVAAPPPPARSPLPTASPPPRRPALVGPPDQPLVADETAAVSLDWLLAQGGSDEGQPEPGEADEAEVTRTYQPPVRGGGRPGR